MRLGKSTDRPQGAFHRTQELTAMREGRNGIGLGKMERSLQVQLTIAQISQPIE